MPILTSLTTEELRAFAVRQAKLRLRWDRKPGLEKVFALAGLTEERSYHTSLWLLSGGEDVLLMSDDGEIKLCRIMLSNTGASLKRLSRTNLDLGEPSFLRKQFFYETTPHPSLAVWEFFRRYVVCLGITPIQTHYTITVSFTFFLSTKRTAALKSDQYLVGPARIV